MNMTNKSICIVSSTKLDC